MSANDEWNASNNSRVEGAKCALEDAVDLLRVVMEYGQCPHSKSNLKDAIMLANGAVVMLGRVGGG